MPRERSNPSDSRPSHLIVGTVGRAVGLGGDVEVAVTSDTPDRFAPGSRVLVAPDLRPLTVRGARSHRGRTIVAFAGITDRSGAEALRGAELVVPIEDARRLGSDEYWDHDLVGCEVVTTDGRQVGTVTDVLHAPANDVLVVRGEGREHLVPLTGEVVREVARRERITIEPIPGLLDA